MSENKKKYAYWMKPSMVEEMTEMLDVARQPQHKDERRPFQRLQEQQLSRPCPHRPRNRLARGMTQEQLANEVGVVVTHISHIETGNSVPSLKTLIDIINALDCSADELLCIEIKKAKPVFDSWMSEQLADCSADEAKIIKETVVSLKKSLRKVYGKSSKYRYD